MADEEQGSRRAEMIAAGLTIGLALILGFIALDVLRSRKAKPCGCQDSEAGGM